MIAFRFAFVYFITALLDYAAFWLALRSSGNIFLSQVAGRAASVPFNYIAVRAKVFKSHVRHETAGPKFLLLYTTAFFAAWAMIETLKEFVPLRNPDHRVLVAKMFAEGAILIIKFFIQKHFIFRSTAE